jgi:uncharacterized membrane protein
VPALRALRAANPDAHFTLIGLPAAQELAARLRRYLDGFVAFPGFPGMPGIECDLDAVPDFFERMKRQRFDLAVQMHGSGEVANPLMVLMGAARNAGYHRGGRYCPDAQRYLEWRDDEDEVRRWLRLAAHLGAVPRGTHLELPLEARDWEQWRELRLEHYVCLHCRSQPRRFAEVGDALATEGWNVVLTGSDAVRGEMHQPAVSLAGRTDLGGTAAAIAKASLVVTNDPDALLIAAAMRTPAAVLTADTPRERILRLALSYLRGDIMERIEKSIEVACPVRTVYNQWTQFEEFPRFMAGVKEVKQLDDTHLHWHAEVWGKDKEWDAEITEQVPDQVIAWRSTSGAPNAGTVRFEPVSHDRTRVRLIMEYEPEGVVEKTGDAVGVFGARVQNSVEDFKKFVEKRGGETGAWRGEVHGGAKKPTAPGGGRTTR